MSSRLSAYCSSFCSMLSTTSNFLAQSAKNSNRYWLYVWSIVRAPSHSHKPLRLAYKNITHYGWLPASRGFYRVSQSSQLPTPLPPRLSTIFSLGLSIFIKFCTFLAIYIHMSLPTTDFSFFILRFHEMALILLRTPIILQFQVSIVWFLLYEMIKVIVHTTGKLSFDNKLRIKHFGSRGWCKSHRLTDKGWKLSSAKKVWSRVDSTGSAVIRLTH